MKIVFFGAGDFVLPIIQTLKDHGLILILTTEKEGKIIDFAKEHNIELISTHFQEDAPTRRIEELKPDLGVLAAFGAYIPQAVIEMFPLGILNIHPSLLPKFKGPAPVPFTITAGDEKTGVTIIQMDDKLDHGPIVMQEEVELTGTETSQELLELLFFKSSKMIQEIVQSLENGKDLQLTSQDHKLESWTEKLEKDDGKIDLKNPPDPVILDRKMRAFHPWPGVYLTVSLKGQVKKLKLLPHGKIQVEGKNPMLYKDFINGYGEEASSILTSLNLLQ